jgi:hypothetical protein
MEDKIMASNFTMTVYLGAGEEGLNTDKLIKTEAKKRDMTNSEFVLACVRAQLAAEKHTLGGKK